MEIVYILTNQAMPDYVKVGRTKDLQQRLKSLYRTPVPLPFEVFYACTVENSMEVEAWLFEIFDDRRVSKEREFFEIAPERVAAALRARAVQEVTPKQTYTENKEDEVALEKARSKRDKFNFAMVGIPAGAELTFSRDENIRARVVDNHNIEYNGKVTSLSTSAQEILGYNYGVAGTLYWSYEGETLHARRVRMEEGE
ncbi:MAG: GIY-YIG nuclease family protein [Candidatus Pacebacteria bacterium]|nr:GIY-YIG nuclease family protein [Candidatus Paceibacterota bacterium]